MQSPDDENIIFKTAAGFINNSNYPVFLTGKAGTGKTTFLKFIKETSSKNIAIVAPTGVAAINAGGNTIHSFFQLPFAPYVPVNNQRFAKQEVIDKHNLLGKLRLTAERKEVMQELELLIIDEISMVRCDVLDAIDMVLRHIRRQHSKPFGGVQVLYIGDMYQLPPVIKEDEWQLLSSCYENQFFFSSLAIIEQPPVYIELKKVYRQNDQVFINLLNQVRNNEMGEEDYELLHSRYLPEFKAGKEDNFITLTTHNNKADTINTEALAKLYGEPFAFKAIIEGEFYEKSFPADEYLNLKTGAQVMFIKNDMEKVRRYYNGKIGVVHKVEDDKIWVTCKNGLSEQLIEVKKEVWRNIKYTINNKTQQIEEQELGSFTQYPLRLAWAITIHKSQGLTFEKAIIDAGAAFAPGQVYVALSRCTSLEGIVLKSKISYNSLHSDDRIVNFSAKQQSCQAQAVMLHAATKQYQQDIITQLFDFKAAERILNDLLFWIKENNSLGITVYDWLTKIQQQLNIYLQHSTKFAVVLNELFIENKLPEENELLKQRLAKAGDWFFNDLSKTKKNLLQSPAISDNRQLAKDYNGKLQKLFDTLCLQIHLLDVCRQGFTLHKYREQKAIFKKELFTVNTYSGKSAYISRDILHPELYSALKDKRDEICREKNIPVYLVCSTQSLEQMTAYLPQALHDLGKISGFGKIKLKQFGNDFVSIIQNYCELHGLESNAADMPEKKIKKPKAKTEKPDTKKLSFDLYKEGRTLNQVAAKRNLALSTVEGHLAYFIETGELDIDELLDPVKQSSIRNVIKQTGSESLQMIREQLPTISYAEVKWVIASAKKHIQ
ncbi:MAG: helix-turn-helix domain-containing protein [Ferruginibacter sp.]